MTGGNCLNIRKSSFDSFLNVKKRVFFLFSPEKLCIELKQCCKVLKLFLWNIVHVPVSQGQLQEAKLSLSEVIFMNGFSLYN